MFRIVVRVPGVEPEAYRLGGGRSILLSYTRKVSNIKFIKD